MVQEQQVLQDKELELELEEASVVSVASEDFQVLD